MPPIYSVHHPPRSSWWLLDEISLWHAWSEPGFLCSRFPGSRTDGDLPRVDLSHYLQLDILTNMPCGLSPMPMMQFVSSSFGTNKVSHNMMHVWQIKSAAWFPYKWFFSWQETLKTEHPQRSVPVCIAVSQETKRFKHITTQLHVCHFITSNHLDDLVWGL